MPSALPPKPEPDAPATVIRRYRATVRTRLAVAWAALLTVAGALMLTLVYVFMRYVPTYDLVPSSSVPTQKAVSLQPTSIAPPTPSGDLSLSDRATVGSPAAATEPASALVVSSTDQMFHLLLVSSLLVLLVLAVTGAGVGWAVAGRMLKPLHHLNTAAARAAQGDLSHRIGLVGPRDEISELAANFDHMLAQLESSFAASKRFALNASHELLTPLATTRAMLDVALTKSGRAVVDPTPADPGLLHRLQDMNERSIDTVQALLTLARVQSVALAPEPVDLAALVGEVVAAETALHAESMHLNLVLDEAVACAEPTLLRQLIANLMQNAVRHNRATDPRVSVTTGVDANTQRVVLEVSNTGQALTSQQVVALTEQFSRAGGRVAPSGRGHGLGLSIVAATVERFEGTLEVSPRPEGGLTVRVQLPRAR